MNYYHDVLENAGKTAAKLHFCQCLMLLSVRTQSSRPLTFKIGNVISSRSHPERHLCDDIIENMILGLKHVL